MLTHLSIRDVVLIERLDLDLGPGLTVLTGETGAGKSILLDSLNLALGERASAGLIRNGASQASVSATFEVPPAHPIFALLQEQGIPSEEPSEPLVLRRVVTADGRSRAYVSDQPVGIALLRRVAALLVEIQGQHEQIGLADQGTHLDLLDAFGVDPALREAASAAFGAWSRARGTLEAARAARDAAAKEEDWLRETVADLGRLAPKDGEEESLAALRTGLQQDERRGEAVAAALAELTPRDRRSQGPAAALRNAGRALSRLLPADGADASGPHASPHASRAQEALDALEKAEEALSEAETLLARLAADTEPDPRLLEETEERLFALRAEARKHGVPVGGLPGLLDDLSARLSALETGEAALAKLEQEAAASRASYEAAARALSAARETAARALEQAVSRELRSVRLERARFVVSLAPLPPAQWGRSGAEQVAFLIAANPGQPPAPLAKAASGGELSRLMLALKVVLAGRSEIGTLVFDEVDAGVGGATASAIGDRLSKVAGDVQVLVVTHSPQVAARGDHHLRIAKRVRDQRTETLAHPLTPEARREEIARMLAGDVITEAARVAADSLLERKP